MSKPFLSEKELVQGCIRRDRDAQQELYARYAARLYTLCLRYIGDSEESRDLMHDSMIKAMDSIKSFRNEADGSLYSWLRKITVNVVFDRFRLIWRTIGFTGLRIILIWTMYGMCSRWILIKGTVLLSQFRWLCSFPTILILYPQKRTA